MPPNDRHGPLALVGLLLVFGGAWLLTGPGGLTGPLRAPAPPPAPAEATAPEAPEEPTAAAPSPEPSAKDALRRLRPALASVACGAVEAVEDGGAVAVTGAVAGDPAREAVSALVAEHARGLPARIDVAVAPATLCEPLALVDALRRLNRRRVGGLSLETVPRGGVFSGGDLLRLDITAPDFGGQLQVDYYSPDGTVVHLFPNPSEPDARMTPRELRRLGEADGGGRFWTVGPPFGLDLVVAIATAQPLFAGPRPEAEPTAAYLADLKAALEAASATPPMVATARFVTTRGP